MEIETMNAMSENMSMMMMKVMALITLTIAITGFAIYLAGIAWLCFKEGRRRIPASRTPRRLSSPENRKSIPRVPNTPVERFCQHATRIKVAAAIESLQRAEAAGAGDLSELKNSDSFVSRSLKEHARMPSPQSAPPSPGQAMQLETI